MLHYYGAAYKSVSQVVPKIEHRDLKILVEDASPSLDFNTIICSSNLLNQVGKTIFKEMNERYICVEIFPNQFLADHVKIKSSLDKSSKINK